MKQLYFLTIFILIFFPFGELMRFSLGNAIFLKPLDFIVTCAAILFTVLVFFKKIRTQSFYVAPIALFSGIGLLSLLLNSYWLQFPEFITSFLYLIRWISYSCFLLLILFLDKKKKIKIRSLALSVGAVILLIGFIQYLYYPSLKPYIGQGWDEHMHRLFAVFLDPNFAGAFFVLYLIFVAGELYRRGKLISDSTLFFKSKMNILLCTLCFLTLLAILLTFSRAALLMLFVSTGVFCILIQKKKIFFGLLAVIFCFFVSISSQFYIENINIFREASSKARIANYITALGIISSKPFIGVGFNSYRYAKTNIGVPSNWTGAPSHADAGVDNSYLFVWATTGIIGLLAYIWLWWRIMNRSLTIFKKYHSPQSIVVLSSISGLFINALFINSLFFPACLLWTYLMIGIQEE